MSALLEDGLQRLAESFSAEIEGDWQRDLRLLRDQYVSVFAGVIAEGVEVEAALTGMVLGAVGATH